MDHDKHTAWMLGLAAVGGVLLLTGVGSGAVLLLWPLACAVMMGAMMWAMSSGRSQDSARRRDEDRDSQRDPADRS